MATKSLHEEFASLIVKYQNRFEAMSVSDYKWAIDHPKEAIHLFTQSVSYRDKHLLNWKPLKFVSFVEFPSVERFNPSDKFRADETIDGVNIGSVGDEFKRNFLDKIEEPITATEGRVHHLVTYADDKKIISDLGGTKNAVITLGQFWEFLKIAKWKVGEKSVRYIAFIRDVENVPRPVDVFPFRYYCSSPPGDRLVINEDIHHKILDRVPNMHHVISL